MNRRQLIAHLRYIGQKGGLATLERYGSLHYSKIGSLGGRATRDKYALVPWGQSDYAMTNRLTGKIVAYLSGASIHERSRAKW